MSLVSICIPSYKPKHFELCLASAVAQTYPHIEIVVSDQCPTEEIREICERFPGKVKYSRNPEKGSQNNVLRALELGQGEYIKYLFDDDILDPFCVQQLVVTMEKTRHLNTTLAFSPRRLIDEENNMMQTVNLLNVKDSIEVTDGPIAIRNIAVNLSNFIGEFTTALFRKKDAYDNHGRIAIFDFGGQRYRGLGDVSCWFHFASKGSIAVHPETLSYFRQHTASNSNPASNPEFIYAITDWELLINKAAELGYLDKMSLLYAYKNLIQSYGQWLPQFPQLMNDVQRLRELVVKWAHEMSAHPHA